MEAIENFSLTATTKKVMPNWSGCCTKKNPAWNRVKVALLAMMTLGDAWFKLSNEIIFFIICFQVFFRSLTFLEKSLLNRIEIPVVFCIFDLGFYSYMGVFQFTILRVSGCNRY